MNIHILGEIKYEWIDHNIIDYKTISTNLNANFVQKQSNGLQWFPKLLNNIP